MISFEAKKKWDIFFCHDIPVGICKPLAVVSSPVGVVESLSVVDVC